MPSRQAAPRLCHHKATGQGYVTLNGRVGSPEAEAKYEELIARWLAHGQRRPRPGGDVDRGATPALTTSTASCGAAACERGSRTRPGIRG